MCSASRNFTISQPYTPGMRSGCRVISFAVCDANKEHQGDPCGRGGLEPPSGNFGDHDTNDTRSTWRGAQPPPMPAVRGAVAVDGQLLACRSLKTHVGRDPFHHSVKWNDACHDKAPPPSCKVRIVLRSLGSAPKGCPRDAGRCGWLIIKDT